MDHRPPTRRAALLLWALLLPGGAFGDGPDGWELEAVPTQPGQETSPSAPEQQRFWDRLQQKAFDDICRGLDLNLKQGFKLSEYGGVTPRIDRRLQRYANRTLALVDTAELDISVGTAQKVFEAASEVPFTIGFDGRVTGAAVVVRPLGVEKSCGEIGRLLNLLDFKTVVPVHAERLSGMAVGELWRLPMVMRAGVRAGVGGPAGPVAFGVSLGYGQEDAASVTVFRLSETAIRLRIRLDKAQVVDGGGSVRLNVPLQQSLGLDGGASFLEKQTDRLLWRQASRYLEAALGYSDSARDGRKVLLEFVIDPRDPEQLGALTRFLKGDLDVLFLLRRIASAAADPFVRDGSMTQELSSLEGKYSGKLGVPPTYSGVDDYTRRGRGFHLQLPIVLEAAASSSQDFDRIIDGDKGMALHINQASRVREGSFLNIPVLGQLTKHNVQQTVQTFVRVDDKGFPDDPSLVFLRQEGYLRHSALAARGMVEKANDVMRLAGARGEGSSEALALPVDTLFPKPPEPPPPPSWEENPPPAPASPIYRSAVTAFTVVFNREALQDVLWSPAEVVVRAYANSLSGEERSFLETVLAHGSVAADGSVSYDREKVRAAVEPFPDNERASPMGAVEDLARTAAKLAADLAQARQGDWDERCRSLVKIVSGQGRSGLAYEAVLKVLVQLAEPSDLYGEFSVQTHKKTKGETDVSGRYLLHKANSGPQLQEAARLKERFSEPSVLVD